MPVQAFLVGEALARISRSATTEGSGAAQLANYFAGQVVGHLDRVMPAGRVVLAMVEDYVEAAERVGASSPRPISDLTTATRRPSLLPFHRWSRARGDGMTRPRRPVESRRG